MNRFVDESEAGATEAGASALEAAREAMRRWLGLLGLEIEEAAASRDDLSPRLVELLLQLRQEARARKEFAAADAIRTRLGELGVVVEDRPQGATWRLA